MLHIFMRQILNFGRPFVYTVNVVILRQNFILEILKRIFYILLLTVGFHFSSQAQFKPALASGFSSKTVKLYPNPAVSFINFEFLKEYDPSYSLEIYNFIGKKITEIKPSDRKIMVSLTDFYRGIYIFQLKDKQGNIVEAGKFQVAK